MQKLLDAAGACSPVVHVVLERIGRPCGAVAGIGRWGCVPTGDLHPAFSPVFTPGRYTAATGPGALASVAAAGLAPVAGKLALPHAHLRGRDWLAANKRTVLDAYAPPMPNWARSGLPDALAPCPSAAEGRAR